MDDLKTIILGLIASAIYSYFAMLYRNRNINKTKYSKGYVKSVKIEFYTSFVITIVLLAIPHTSYEFVNIMVKDLALLALFFCLMGFMCLVDVINFLTDSVTDDNTDDK